MIQVHFVPKIIRKTKEQIYTCASKRDLRNEGRETYSNSLMGLSSDRVSGWGGRCPVSRCTCAPEASSNFVALQSGFWVPVPPSLPLVSPAISLLAAAPPSLSDAIAVVYELLRSNMPSSLPILKLTLFSELIFKKLKWTVILNGVMVCALIEKGAVGACAWVLCVRAAVINFRLENNF